MRLAVPVSRSKSTHNYPNEIGTENADRVDREYY